jgi:nascent polypeptide-associated complex subunit alpha
MIPGMNAKQVHQMMKKMGMQQEEIEATEVIIRTPEGDILIKDPQVSKVNVMGQTTYQIVGEEEKVEAQITHEDIETVASQAGVSLEYARAALEDAKGDIAEAIILLKKD